jgi:hypothetical protein
VRSNIDHIATYLDMCPDLTSLALFNRYYPVRDSKFLHDRWQTGALLPLTLNNVCEELVKELRLSRAGMRLVES